MKLLQPEVDIVPGRAGQRPQVTPVREDQPLPGSSVIRLSNTTSQENAYTIRVRCEQPFWQESWYTVVALAPGQGAENAPPPGKPDQRGPQDRWVKIYVPRNGTRDVLIRFNVPPRPESRAGKYDYTIEVETQVIGPAESGRRKERVAQVPGVAIVRPYYKWNVDLSPEERRVSRRVRSAEFEIVVTNEGNDWLYCDMHLPRPKDMQIDGPTLRLAVPPPEPGETLPPLPGSAEPRPGTQRTVPLTAATKLKTFRGDVARQPLMVSAQRVDAPSVPPPASDGYAGMGAVVANGTTETQQAPPDRALVYCPPVPAKFTDFFTKGATSIRTMAFGLIGLAAAVILGLILYQNAFYEGVKVEPQSLTAQPGKPLLVSGQFLQGCRLFMGTKDNYIPVEYKPDLFNPKRVTIKAVPPELNHKEVKIKAQRFIYFLPFLTSLLPSNESKSLVQVGSIIQAAAQPTVQPADPGPYKPGQQFTVAGQNLGADGYVLINNLRAKAFWSANKITATIPSGAKPGAELPVVVMPSTSSAPLSAGSIEIASPQVAAVPKSSTPAGPAAPKAGGGSPGGGGGAPAGAPAPKPTQTAPKPPPHIVSVPRPVAVPRPVVSVPRPKLGKPPYDLILTGAYPQAVGAANDILARNPNDASAQALKAIALIKTGNAAAAQGPSAAALRLTAGQAQGRPRALALLAQGVLAEANNDLSGAAQAYQSAGRMDQSLILTYIIFASSLQNRGQHDQAKLVLQQALVQKPTGVEASALHAKMSGL